MDREIKGVETKRKRGEKMSDISTVVLSLSFHSVEDYALSVFPLILEESSKNHCPSPPVFSPIHRLVRFFFQLLCLSIEGWDAKFLFPHVSEFYSLFLLFFFLFFSLTLYYFTLIHTVGTLQIHSCILSASLRVSIFLLWHFWFCFEH